MPSFPEWWTWELLFTGHARLRMEQRGISEIDARAMLENSTDEESYLAGWRWSEWHARPGDAQTVLNQVIAELEAYLDPRH